LKVWRLGGLKVWRLGGLGGWRFGSLEVWRFFWGGGVWRVGFFWGEVPGLKARKKKGGTLLMDAAFMKIVREGSTLRSYQKPPNL